MFMWAGSVAQNASQAYVPAPNDQVLLKFDANTYIPQKTLRLQRLYALAPNATEISIDSPLTRPIGPPQIQPFDTGTEPSTLPPINKYDANAMTWATNDPMGIRVSRAGSGAADCQVLGWVSDTQVGKVDGPTWPVKMSVPSTVLTTTSWVGQTATVGQSLPPGNYRVVGMSALGSTLLAARLVFQNQVWRPGCLAQDAAAEYDWEWFRRGNFGDYGVFNAYALPTVELVGLSAGAATATIWIDIQPLSGQAPQY